MPERTSCADGYRPLEIGEGQNKIGFEGKYLRNVGKGECGDPRLLTPHPRRPDGVPGNADNAILLAEKV